LPCSIRISRCPLFRSSPHVERMSKNSLRHPHPPHVLGKLQPNPDPSSTIASPAGYSSKPNGRRLLAARLFPGVEFIPERGPAAVANLRSWVGECRDFGGAREPRTTSGSPTSRETHDELVEGFEPSIRMVARVFLPTLGRTTVVQRIPVDLRPHRSAPVGSPAPDLRADRGQAGIPGLNHPRLEARGGLGPHSRERIKEDPRCGGDRQSRGCNMGVSERSTTRSGRPWRAWLCAQSGAGLSPRGPEGNRWGPSLSPSGFATKALGGEGGPPP